jgi:hypothetical protein
VVDLLVDLERVERLEPADLGDDADRSHDAAGVLTAHGSGLGVRSESGGGAKFAFTLPTRGMVSRMPDRVRAT